MKKNKDFSTSKKNNSAACSLKVHVGCSGYYYKHWIGRFYPDGTKTSQFFQYYQQYFHTVEINSTFYHYPTEKQIDSWLNKSTDDFIFTLKAPRLITHKKRLIECRDSLLLFLHLIKPIRQIGRLGVILFQTPASHPFDIDSLERFLDDLPTGYKYAFEFRNREYYATEIYELLASRNMDFAYVSEPEGTPFAGLLAPFKYFRMHGARNRYESDYSDEELRLFGEELMRVQRAGCDEVYVYFNNDFNAFAPQNALTLMNIIEEINAE